MRWNFGNLSKKPVIHVFLGLSENSYSTISSAFIDEFARETVPRTFKLYRKGIPMWMEPENPWSILASGDDGIISQLEDLNGPEGSLSTLVPQLGSLSG